MVIDTDRSTTYDFLLVDPY